MVERYRGALAAAGDVGRGREVFVRACAACHRRGEEGRNVGPNLATVVEHAPERLLANILDPSADIQPGYQSYTCVLVTANKSFMPEGVETTVPVEQMRDLLAFLRGPL